MKPALSRRKFLERSSCGMGSLALAALLAERVRAEGSPLAGKRPHFRPRAKRVIFLFMKGGPSQMDLFDYKPRLRDGDGQELPFNLSSREATVGLENTKLLGPIAPFHRQGECGLLMTDLLPHLAGHADDLCVLRGMQADSPNHEPAISLLHTGTQNFFWPSMGSWLSYGLGTENQNLPGYVTIKPVTKETTYGSAFLPAIHQATAIQSLGEDPATPPVRHLDDPHLSRSVQRRRLDFLQELNRRKQARIGEDQEMEGLIQSFELAFRMQTETPKYVDISNESQATLDLYGIGEELSDSFGRQCLLARRFAEAGVRFVQVSLDGWDHHGQIRTQLPRNCGKSDKPIAGLLTDLKQRGLLDDTLVLWSGEFGRTPHSQDLPDGQAGVGREHNHRGFTAWLAGGGVKGGITHGETDEFGYSAVDGKVHIHDLHATLLHLLGIDHELLTYAHAGRDFRLTDVFGHVVEEILA